MKVSNYILDTFSVENYKSFFKKQTISFSGPVKAFYGGNASGKTNLFSAMLVFRRFIEQSADPNSHGTPCEPFLLSNASSQKPSCFSISFHSNDASEAYEYSVSVLRDRVVEEEMYDKSSSRPRLIFKRSKGYTDATARNGFGKKMFEGDNAVRQDSLLITFARSTNNRYSNAVFEAIRSIEFINLATINSLRGVVVDVLQRKPYLHNKLVDLFKKADFSVNSFSYNVSRITSDMLLGAPFSDDVKKQILATGQSVIINTVHSVRDSKGDKVGDVTFNMEAQESLGTNIFFILAVAMLDIIDDGKTIYIDEFGASTHTMLCNFIIKLFKINKNNARLIINTHDTGLIKNGSVGTLGRDEIYIVEKDRFDETLITPLQEKMQRADENIGKKYILGMYGGIPILSEVDN